MSDEGFHEIQLNGKQLVFLFMAATVVFVVIFLLGVMVGRGVPSSRVRAAEVAEASMVDPTAAVDTSSGSVATSSGSVAADSDRAPVSAQESLTYAERLSTPTPAAETKAPIRETVVDVPPPPPPVRQTPPPPEAETLAARRTETSAPVKEPAAVQTAAAPSTTTFTEPAGSGLVVQVGAYPRATAESIARRLSSKGYPVFIAPRPQGLFAVRVGKYNDRREADAVATRLEQQEQFNKPWVTR